MHVCIHAHTRCTEFNPKVKKKKEEEEELTVMGVWRK
jgi:hypothetical protein